MGFNRTGGNQTAASTSAPAYAVSGKIMLTAIAIMLTAVFLVLLLHLYLRWAALHRSSPNQHLRRRRRRRRGLAGFVPNPSAARRGLDPAVLESITVVIFSSADDVDDKAAAAAECAVCLSEFEEGEKARLLPLCAHRFHVDCIDMWFYSHTTCPLCRSSVDLPAPVPTLSSPQIARPEAGPLPESSGGTEPDQGNNREEAIGSSEDSGEPELRIDVPARESGGEISVLKSPGSRLLLLRILNGDLMIYRSGGETTQEPDLEQGQGETHGPPLLSTLRLPSPSPAPEL